MRVGYGDGHELYHLPLPSGKYAVIRLYTRYMPVAVEMDEICGTNVLDLEALGLSLIELARQLKHPEGIIVRPEGRAAASNEGFAVGRKPPVLLDPDAALLAGFDPDAIDPPTAPPAPPPSPAP